MGGRCWRVADAPEGNEAGEEVGSSKGALAEVEFGEGTDADAAEAEASEVEGGHQAAAVAGVAFAVDESGLDSVQGKKQGAVFYLPFVLAWARAGSASTESKATERMASPYWRSISRGMGR